MGSLNPSIPAPSVTRGKYCRKLVASVSHRLASLGLTIAFGESATGGSLAYTFSLVRGAGEILEGGIVCYGENVKKMLLEVPDTLLAEFTAESPEVTRQIAFGVCRLMPAHIVVAVTGLVRPGGSESEGKPVGTIFFAVLYKGRCYEREIQVKGKPEAIVEATISEVCIFLLNMLEE